MADKMILKGVAPYDGEYELDTAQSFTMGEWRWIKRISGYMPVTAAQGLEGGDPDLFVALAVVALHRSGRIAKEEALDVGQKLFTLLDDEAFEGSAITFKGEVKKKDPPPLSQETNAGDESKSVSNASSGDDSTTRSESQENGQSLTGMRSSAANVVSEQPT